MPTATTTTKTSTAGAYRSISLKSPAPMPAETTLRSLYNRAARSFLNRDNSQTYALLDSAFALLSPRSESNDQLKEQRKKWDILRITLDTTVRSSNIGIEPTDRLVSSWYTRSLELFTPQAQNSKSAIARDVSFLPTAVLTTLMYSSIKLDCAHVGRDMAEEWLAKRTGGEEGYEKIVELFVLQILPKLREWEHAQEFLTFENELQMEVRQGFKETLAQLKLEASKPKPKSVPPSEPSSSFSSRSYSPTPSSSSSSLSTTSTHTVVPNGIAKLAREESSVSVSTVKPPRRQNKARSRTPPVYKRAVSVPDRTMDNSSNSISTLALIRQALSTYFASSRLSIGAILCVIVPLFSFFLRLRRRGGSAQLQRQIGGKGAGEGVVGRLVAQVVRAVGDTVRMGGSGLI